jgi:thiosulfate/3-mercaptopyruvate sulfurtransferase
MKKRLSFTPLFMLLILGFTVTNLVAQKTSALVTTEWLENNIDRTDMVLLDVRTPESYTVGHIPGSTNVPAYPNFYINAPGGELPWMELPEKENLFKVIGNAGITANNTVVVIGSTSDSPTGEPAEYNITKTMRAAITLIYAGIKDVKYLDGGYDKWIAEGKIVSTESVIVKPLTYNGDVQDSAFISKIHVKNKLGKSIIIDTRDADSYYGLKNHFSTERAGHIPTAKNLPAPWFWKYENAESEATRYLIFKDVNEIKEICYTVLGENMEEEIIDYCGVGGYASPVWFLLTQVVGYTNVKFYDGSMQEWASYPDAPVTKYKYE